MRLPSGRDTRSDTGRWHEAWDGDTTMTTVRMDIPAGRASVFARILQDEGAEVMWEESMDKPASGEGAVVQVLFYLKGSAAYAAAQDAVTKIHDRYPAVTIGKIEIDDTPD